MKRILSSLYLLLISISLLANDRFAVADIFTDHMVLQRNANVKVWGEERTVRWLKFVLKDKTGRWWLQKANGWLN